MLESLLRGSPEPLSDELMAIFPVIANITIDTEDSSIMQVRTSLHTACRIVPLCR